MKILFALIFTISFLRVSDAQDISKQVVASSGNTISNSTYQITSTVGEAVIGLKNNTVTINQGFLAGAINTSTLTDSEFGMNDNVKFYPNPVTENLHIDIEDLTGTSISIYDLTGKELLNKQLNSKNSLINLGQLQSGMYVVQLQFQDNKGLKVFKILKQ